MLSTRAPVDPALVERSRQRQRDRLVRRIRPWLIGIMVVAALGLGVWVVMFSSWLAVSDVGISGEHIVSEQQVLHAAAVPIGRPLVRVDLDAVRRRVEAIPAVDQARVQRSWPHGITISVTERVQAAVLQRHGQSHAVDKHGIVFRTLPRPTPGYPQIDVVRDDPQLVRAAAEVAAALPPFLVRDVQTIRAKTAESLELALTHGRTVVWGSARDSTRKAEVTRVLLRTSARIYDVSVPELPTTTQ